MDEAPKDTAVSVTFDESEAMKTILRIFLLGAGASLNVTTIEEVNGCTTAHHFAKIAACALHGLNNILREHADVLKERADWQGANLLLLREKGDWLEKEIRLEREQTELVKQVDSLQFGIKLLKNENQKQKELGHALERRLKAEKEQLSNQLKESRKTTKKLRAQVEARQHIKSAQPETPSGAQRASQSELETELASRDTALEKAQNLIQQLQNENHELAEAVDKSKTDKRALNVTPQLPSPASARVNAAKPEVSSKQVTSMKDLAAAIRDQALSTSSCNDGGMP